MGICYKKALEFKNKYPSTIAWRIKAHSKVVEKHLNHDEEVLYVFVGQKDFGYFDIFSTNLIALTNKRIMIVSKRVLFGYNFKSITPDMYNDLTVMSGIIWGKICIDTVKEIVQLSNLDKDALPEIETKITQFMINAKKEYAQD